MKNKLRLLFLLFIVGYLQPLPAQTKHALIIAIGNYPKAGGWPPISSIRDADYIKQTLLKQDFPAGNIKTVTDASATVKGIADAMTALIHEVQPGDVALIHFSMHGEQVQDDNGDETDGKDEAIVTYNAIAPSKANKKDYQVNQAQYFRDDQFGSLIDQLRNKLGKTGDVVVFMDLCHSGTGTRGLAKVRGNEPPLVSENFKEANYNREDTAGVFREKSASRGDQNTLATYVVFSAARAEELDYETTDDHNEGMGSLSYAVCKAFENLGPGTTYRGLFAKIQTIMSDKAPGQHPVVEGNGTDRMLFGGNIVQQKAYVEVAHIDGTEVTIKSGLFAGLDVGAAVAIYPAGTIDPAKAGMLSEGTVIKADSYTAKVKLKQPLKNQQPASCWAFVTGPVYNIDPIVVNIQSRSRGSANGFSESEITNLKEGLKDLPLIKFEGAPQLIFVKGETEDSIKVASNGYLFAAIKDADVTPDRLKNEFEKYARYKFLLNLEITDPQVNIDVRIVRVVNGKADTSKIHSNNIQGIDEYAVGDTIAIYVKNKSEVPVYFNILDLQPDGIINPLLPLKQKGIYPTDLKIEGGSFYLFNKGTITIAPPYGIETFKIFISRKEIDMEGIAASRGMETRGNLSILEKIVKNSYDIGTRGATLETSNKEGSVKTLQFRIK